MSKHAAQALAYWQAQQERFGHPNRYISCFNWHNMGFEEWPSFPTILKELEAAGYVRSVFYGGDHYATTDWYLN